MLSSTINPTINWETKIIKMKTKIKFSLLSIVILVAGTFFNMVSAQNPVLAIAADDMNVLYTGVDNPVTIAVSGVGAGKISATINNGTITGKNGKYIVKIAKSENATIEVLVDGKKIGKKTFRVYAPSIFISEYSSDFKTPNAKAEKSVMAIAADKMNEFYIGIDNPVTIAVSGVAADKIIASINNGTITGSNGKYIVKVAKSENATIEISVDGKKVGKQVFLVKQIPAPLAYIGNYTGDVTIPKSELEKIENIVVGCKNFPLDVNLKIKLASFHLSCKSNQGIFKNDMQYNNVNEGTKAMKELFKTAKSGEKIYITDIFVTTPSARFVRIYDINITVF